MADTPTAYYRLDETSGTAAADFTGNGNGLTYAAGVGLGVNPGALSDGDGAAAASPSAANLVLSGSDAALPSRDGARTAELWFRTSTKIGFTPVLTYGDVGVNGAGFQIYVADSGKVAVNADNGGGASLQFPTGIDLTDGAWHYYAVTMSTAGTTSSVTVFVDGHNIGTGQYTFLANTLVPGTGLTIGAYPGDYDEVAIYPTALPADRISAHWTRAGGGTDCAAVPTSGYGGAVNADDPAVYLRLGEKAPNGNARVAYDSSKNCHNGSFQSGATGKPEGGLAEADGAAGSGFAGVAAQVSDAALPSRDGARTAELWFRTSTKIGFTPVLTYGNVGVNGAGFQIYVADSGKVAVNADNGGGASLQFPTGIDLTDGAWHYYAVTMSTAGTTSSVTVFVDGHNIGTGQYTFLANTLVPGTGLTIGAYPGDYDEVAIYPTALPADRISAHWTRAGGGTDCAAVPTSGYGGAVNADDPAVYLRLGEKAPNGNARVAYDSSKNCHNGSFQSGATGKPEGGLAEADGAAGSGFAGVAAQVSDAALPSRDGARTAELWFRTSTKIGFTPVLTYGNVGVNGAGFQIYVADSGKVAVNADNGGGASLQFPTGIDLTDGAWHYYAVTMSTAGTTSSVTVFVDGHNIGTGQYTFLANTLVPGTGLTIGAYPGDYDEVAIYPTALPADRISAHYAARTATSSGSLTSTTLTASPTTATQGAKISLVATVTAPQGGPPPSQGGVTFAAQGATIGTAQLNAMGVAQLDVTTLPAGVNPVTAAYAGAGSYLASVSPVVPVTITGGAPPVITATPTTGVAPLPVAFDATLAGASGSATYAWRFGDGSTGTGTHTTHTYAMGQFVVTVTVTDGARVTSANQVITVGAPEPLTAAAGDDVTTVIGQSVAFNGSASRPPLSISTYTWDFGDGTTAIGVAAAHAYGTAGTYTATLTVRDGTRTATDAAIVTVKPLPPIELALTVSGGGSAPLAGATVLVVDGQGQRYGATSDQSGIAHLASLPDGVYTAYAVAPDYLPGTVPVTVASGAGAATITLVPGKVAVVNVKSAPLTYDQIVAAGIDPAAPENQNAVSFSVNLAVGSSAVGISGVTAAGGLPICPTVTGVTVTCGQGTATFTSGGYQVHLSTSYTNGQPQLAWLVIPAGASWLKEFFSVQMIVTNLAAPAFTLAQGQVTLTLPGGLSLAPTAAPQALGLPMHDIAGGDSATQTWIVRGDNEGTYPVAAGYAAVLQPFGSQVLINATGAAPLHVWGGSAIQVTIDSESDVFDRYPYRVRVGLTNKADVPVYNATVSLKSGTQQHYLYQPLQTLDQQTAAIAPGATFWTDDYILAPDISGSIDLKSSFVVAATGDALPNVQLTSHPPLQDPTTARDMSTVSLKDQVGIVWEPVPGATGYEIYATPNRQTDFPATPVAVLPADADRAVVSSPAGVETWYALSSIVNGARVMLHPIAAGTASADITTPVTVGSVSTSASCGNDIGVTVSVKDPFFDLVGWSATLGGAPIPGASGSLSGRSGSAQFTIPKAILPAKGTALLAVAATDTAGGPGPAWRIQVTADCNPIKIMVVGDSIAWGQGLLDDQKYPALVADQLRQATKRAVVYNAATDNLAHSGGVLDASAKGLCAPDLRATYGYAAGEVPIGTPDIQHCQSPATVTGSPDLVLVDGCINDVGVLKIALSPGTDLGNAVRDLCVAQVTSTITRVHTQFPNAKIVYTGYYPITDATSLFAMIRYASRFGWGAAAIAGLTDVYFAQRSADFHTQVVNQVETVAIKAGALFADPDFKLGDAVFGTNTKLFDGLNDPMAPIRWDICKQVWSDNTVKLQSKAECPVASLGHPNPAGAKKYADAIMAQLKGSNWVGGLNGPPQVSGIQLAPSPITLARGDSQRLTATATYTDGSTGNASTQVTFASANPRVATVDPATQTVKATGVGTTVITAALAANPPKIATTRVTVTPATLRSITLTPPAPLLAPRQSLNVTATGTYSDGTSRALTNLTWSSSAPTIATVSSTGRVTALRVGTTVITASLGTVRATVLVTVLSGPPHIDRINPARGPAGTVVTILGKNFTGITRITIGGVRATVFSVQSNTQITVTVPRGARTGPIIVTSALGNATSPGRFVVL